MADLGPSADRPIPELTEDALRRFWSKVTLPDPESGCMLWTASRVTNGYGQISVYGARYLAHRVAYSLAYGPIPGGMEMGHRCRNRECVSPDHLEVVTRQENMRRHRASR